jgi:hypothetical protein
MGIIGIMSFQVVLQGTLEENLLFIKIQAVEVQDSILHGLIIFPQLIQNLEQDYW